MMIVDLGLLPSTSAILVVRSLMATLVQRNKEIPQVQLEGQVVDMDSTIATPRMGQQHKGASGLLHQIRGTFKSILLVAVMTTSD
jgi:hypothetical protein